MKNLPHGRAIVIGGLLLICGCLGFGFSLDAKGFAGNALAELAGMVASALLAVIIVDRYTAIARKSQWTSVASATTKTVETAAVRAALAAYARLPTPRPSSLDPLMAQAVGMLPAALRDLSVRLRAEGQVPLLPGFDPELFFQDVLPSTRVMTEVVLPRLLSLGAEPRLIEPLVALEGLVAQLEYRAWTSRSMTLPRSTTFEDAADFVLGLAAVASAHLGDNAP